MPRWRLTHRMGESVKSVKSLVGKLFPRTKNDIYAAFMGRGAQRLESMGYLGALTSRTFLNLGSFAELREEIPLKGASAVDHFGFGG